MLTAVDLTIAVGKALPKIENLSRSMIEALAGEVEPVVETNTHCKNCDYAEYCLSREPEHSVIYLPKIKKKEVDSLRLAGHYSIPGIPDEYGLPEKRLRVRDVIRSGRPFISKELGRRLEEIAFPAAFIDYESTASTFPFYPGTQPYEAVCFQWSAHVMEADGAVPVHHEFLAADTADPRAEFCRTLWDVVRHARSIVHYSSFEIYQLRAMAEKGVPLAEELHAAILDRTVDLEQIVDDHVYFEQFRGKTSIKSVLPVLVPELSYENLVIGDGEAATAAFRAMIGGKLELRQALLDYCRQDTFAMIEIYRALRRLCDPEDQAEKNRPSPSDI
jgi:hypothetical protein